MIHYHFRDTHQNKNIIRIKKKYSGRGKEGRKEGRKVGKVVRNGWLGYRFLGVFFLIPIIVVWSFWIFFLIPMIFLLILNPSFELVVLRILWMDLFWLIDIFIVHVSLKLCYFKFTEWFLWWIMLDKNGELIFLSQYLDRILGCPGVLLRYVNSYEKLFPQQGDGCR